ncbi:MAG: glycosyltransferase [Pygmaiobacter sp.]|nr:glycosyltransferase [Pygmaiobacter sp.]
MRILLTTDCYTPMVNGVVTSVLNLRRELLCMGHEVRVLTLAGTNRTTVQDGVVALGSMDMGRVYPGARLRSAFASAEIKELIAWCPDVVHSQCEFSTFFLAVRIAKACAAPLVHTYHTVYEDYTHYFSPSRRWGKCMAQGLTRLVLSKADEVIAPTKKTETLLHRYHVRPPVTVIPTGIDLARFEKAVAAPEKEALQKQLGIPAENKILLFVGRLAKEKNIDELLACRRQMGTDAAVTLLITGDGPERARLERRAAALGLMQNGGVVFAGMVEPQSVPKIYALGDVFVSASTSETQGLTYIEAMAAGLPAVCHADRCLDEVLINGQNGWQYQTGEELLQYAAALLANEAVRKTYSERAGQIAARYSARLFAKRVLQCYAAAGLHRQIATAEKEGRTEVWLSV